MGRAIGKEGIRIDDLVRIICVAEGPVSWHSIYSYVVSQYLEKVSIGDVDDAIKRLVDKGVIEVYDNDEQMKSYW